MWDFVRLGTLLVGRLRTLSGISAVPYSSDQADTSSVHLDCLATPSAARQVLEEHIYLPELTDCSKYSMACS
jgi:hypothetical protein